MLFFDLPCDRFFMLSGSRAERFERFAAGQALAQDIQALQNEGLISPVPGPPRPMRPPVPPATQSLVDGQLQPAAVRATIASLRAQIAARHDLRRHDLPHVIAGLHSQGLAEASADPDTCTGIAAAFIRAARYLPATDQCLARGIAMKRLLFARGCPSKLVFGVTMPFAAHCWVQVGETVLTDPLDIILHYQPIFAV